MLYFGTERRPDREVLTLSELFSSGPGDIEVTATVINCNEGRNAAIMGASETLRGYSHLIALIRAYERSGVDLTEAVDAAIDECIAEGILATYLEDHREEAKELLFTMEDEERAQAVHREAIEREAREKGYKEGYDLGRNDGYSAGRDAGYSAGRDAGYSAGRDAGYSAGRDAGIEQGIENERKRIRAALEAADVDPAIIEAYV